MPKCFKPFQMNPFEVEIDDVLYCLGSGSSAPSDAEHDLLQADGIRKTAHETFVQELLIERKTSLHAPIKKKKLKTFSNMSKLMVTGQSKKTKQITAERNVFGQLVVLALHHDISLEKVLSFPLGSLHH